MLNYLDPMMVISKCPIDIKHYLGPGQCTIILIVSDNMIPIMICLFNSKKMLNYYEKKV